MSDNAAKIVQLKAEIDQVEGRIIARRQANLDATLVNVSEGDVDDLFGVQFKQRKKMKGHTGKIYDAHFCQGDSRSIISAGQEGNLIIWDGYHGDKRDVIKLEASSMWVLACAFSDSGRFVACGGLDNLCSIFTVDNPEKPPVVLKGHKGFISHIRFLSDTEILTSSGDGEICRWDIASKKVVQRYKGHTKDVSAFEKLSPNTLASCSLDKTCKTWDLRVKTGCTSTLRGHDDDINSLCVHPSNNAFGTCSSDGTGRLWDVRADQQIEQYTRNGHDEGIDDECHTIAFSKSGRLLFLGSTQKMVHGDGPETEDRLPDNDIMIWDSLTGDLFMDRKLQIAGSRNRVSTMALSPDGYSLMTAGWDTLVNVWVM